MSVGPAAVPSASRPWQLAQFDREELAAFVDQLRTGHGRLGGRGRRRRESVRTAGREQTDDEERCGGQR